jgi:hypothetical protein
MKIKIIIASYFVYTILSIFVNYSSIAEKELGCCKKREWLADKWQKTDIPFNECKIINENSDLLDNLFEPIGYTWWDSNCDSMNDLN